jgi:predicted SAM-dependent methyltransferase
MRQLLKLNLGCWKRDIPGFINIDICDMPHIHYKRNIDDLSIFEDGIAKLIYASHVFEYFDRAKGMEVLKEWFRVLAPGGVLRIAVPDFEKIVKLYKEGMGIQSTLGLLYGKMEIETENGKEVLYHKTVYDFDSLKQILEEVGFVNVGRYDWRMTESKDYDDHSQAYIPHMDKENGILMSLNVEADKP